MIFKGFTRYCDFSILRNRDNNISKFGNTGFPLLVGKIIEISDMQSIHIQIRPLWTNSYINFQLSHRGATFYILLWKTQHFVGDGFKTIARFKVFRFEVK